MTTNAVLVTLRELQREVQASRAVYESFLVRARETGEQERIDTNNIQVISARRRAAGPQLPAVEPAAGAGRAPPRAGRRQRHRAVARPTYPLPEIPPAAQLRSGDTPRKNRAEKRAGDFVRRSRPPAVRPFRSAGRHPPVLAVVPGIDVRSA